MRDTRWNLEKFRDFHGYLYTVNNGTMDVEGFIDSPYGAELTERLEARFAIEDDRAAAERYYAALGLMKEYHEYEDYYARWTLLVPMKPKSEKLPLVFWLHGGGNSIEAEENMTGFAQIAAREGFLLACPQNTNPEKVFEIIEKVAAAHPLDRSRIYLAGFSQGAAQTHGAYFRRPELFAAVVTSGNDVWQPWDNFNVRYTPEEIEKVRTLRVPLMQICGQCEPFPYSPLNTHKRHGMLAGNFWGRPDTFPMPARTTTSTPRAFTILPPAALIQSSARPASTNGAWRITLSRRREPIPDAGTLKGSISGSACWTASRVMWRNACPISRSTTTSCTASPASTAIPRQ